MAACTNEAAKTTTASTTHPVVDCTTRAHTSTAAAISTGPGSTCTAEPTTPTAIATPHRTVARSSGSIVGLMVVLRVGAATGR